MDEKEQSYPLKDTAAARMLADGLRRVQLEGVSLRKLGQRLEYKQAVVLSHMANGRVPIPIDRALDLAHAVGLPEREFLMACLYQRHPDIDWSLLGDGRPPPGSAANFLWSIESAAGRPFEELSSDQLRIMREVAASPNAARRWLSVHEVGVMEMLRRVKPSISTEGLDRAESGAIEALLE